MLIAAFLVMVGARMISHSLSHPKFIFLWSDHTCLPIMLTIKSITIKQYVLQENLERILLWYLFLDSHLTTCNSNVRCWFKTSNPIRLAYLSYASATTTSRACYSIVINKMHKLYIQCHVSITLFISITMFCGTDNIMWKIFHIQTECGEYFTKILFVPHNTSVDLNNVMSVLSWVLWLHFLLFELGPTNLPLCDIVVSCNGAIIQPI
jgi:hypothetical protein